MAKAHACAAGTKSITQDLCWALLSAENLVASKKQKHINVFTSFQAEHSPLRRFNKEISLHRLWNKWQWY